MVIVVAVVARARVVLNSLALGLNSLALAPSPLVLQILWAIGRGLQLR